MRHNDLPSHELPDVFLMQDRDGSGWIRQISSTLDPWIMHKAAGWPVYRCVFRCLDQCPFGNVLGTILAFDELTTESLLFGTSF